MSRNRIRPTKTSTLPWFISGVAGLALALVLLSPGAAAKHHHPEPRADATQLTYMVMPASFFAGTPEIAKVYQIAQQIPGTLDGIYCYCFCKENLGHHSLLQCFQSQHGSGCDVCLEQARLAYQMTQEGRSLQEIRDVTDARFDKRSGMT